MIAETDTEYTESGKTERSRERGKDSKPRNFSLHTMKNLPQFRYKPHEEIRQYILDKKGVDIGSDFNVGKTVFWVLLGLAVIVGGIGLANGCSKDKKGKMPSAQ